MGITTKTYVGIIEQLCDFFFFTHTLKCEIYSMLVLFIKAFFVASHVIANCRGLYVDYTLPESNCHNTLCFSLSPEIVHTGSPTKVHSEVSMVNHQMCETTCYSGPMFFLTQQILW